MSKATCSWCCSSNEKHWTLRDKTAAFFISIFPLARDKLGHVLMIRGSPILCEKITFYFTGKRHIPSQSHRKFEREKPAWISLLKDLNN